MSVFSRRSPIQREARAALKRALRDGSEDAEPLLLFGQAMPARMYKRFAKERKKLLQAQRVRLPDPGVATAVVVIWGLDPAERPTPAHPVFQNINGVVAVRMGADGSYEEAFAAGIRDFFRTYGDQGPYRLSTPTLEIYDERGGRTALPMAFGLPFATP